MPGVGAFAACMAGLRAVRGDVIIDRRLAGGRPVLGICVGMQVLFEAGDEHGVHTEGCGQWPGTVVPAERAGAAAHGLEHGAAAAEGSLLFAGLDPASPVLLRALLRGDLVPLAASGRLAGPPLTWAEHGEPFIAAVEHGPLSATQFHPEKSGDAGAALLANWLETLR